MVCDVIVPQTSVYSLLFLLSFINWTEWIEHCAVRKQEQQYQGLNCAAKLNPCKSPSLFYCLCGCGTRRTL